MAFSTQSVISDLSNDPFMPEFDEDVRRMVLQMDSPCETLVKAKELKEEGNTLYKSKAYQSAINRYDKAFQYLCLIVPENEHDEKLIEELAIQINLNIATCWLKLKEFELAKRQCDVVMNFDSFNVNARFRRAQALLNMVLSKEANQDLLVAIQLEPYNEEIRDELSRVEKLCSISCNKVPTREVQAQILELDEEDNTSGSPSIGTRMDLDLWRTESTSTLTRMASVVTKGYDSSNIATVLPSTPVP
ncbi:hypothetical protein Cgig2_011513 [Carnegiea gigantea]|uniref:Tetratricopeptide repeat protein n=1 Tax=Carnegiea gigantea TaxID=171969 RepID=A0A9Q1GX05_9CARY|nr:hypothetical protein Cgig2_011513 [Carnegiea gigantea]